jgi:hypothetical protein
MNATEAYSKIEKAAEANYKCKLSQVGAIRTG